MRLFHRQTRAPFTAFGWLSLALFELVSVCASGQELRNLKTHPLRPRFSNGQSASGVQRNAFPLSAQNSKNGATLWHSAPATAREATFLQETQPAQDQGADEQQDPEQQDPQAQDQESVVARLAQLEQRFSDLGSAQDQGGFAESTSTAERSVTGRLHIDAWEFPDSSPGINIIENGSATAVPEARVMYRRIRFGSLGTIEPLNMSYRVEIEFSGADGSNFRDAWIGWDDLVWLDTLRLGNQKRPYGLDHLNSSNFNVFMERPFIVDAFNEDNRRFGIVSYGASENQCFNWRYGVFDLEQIQNSGESVTNDWPLEFAWRLANTWWYDEYSAGRGYGHLGFSGTFAFPARDGNVGVAQFRSRPEGRSTNFWIDTGSIIGGASYQMFNVESVYNVGAFQFTGEYQNLWLQRTGGAGSDVHFHGGYFYLSYFLTGEHIPWNRQLGILGRVQPHENFFSVRSCDANIERGLGAWQVAMRLSYANLNNEDIFGGVGQSATLALNWYWNPHSKLQLNYIHGRIDDRLAALSGGTAIVSGDYQIAGVRFLVDF